MGSFALFFIWDWGGGCFWTFSFWCDGLGFLVVVFWWFSNFCLWFLPFASLWCYVKLRIRHRLILVLCVFFLSLSNRSSILKKTYYFNTDTTERRLHFWSYVTIPTPIFPPFGAVSFNPLDFYWREALLYWREMLQGFVLFWFVSFQDSKWWVYSFCYCWLLGNFSLQETCVIWVCVHVCSTKFHEPNTCLCFAFS